MATQEQMQDILCNRFFWHTAERDDARMAHHLFHRREMDVVCSMDEASLLVVPTKRCWSIILTSYILCLLAAHSENQVFTK